MFRCSSFSSLQISQLKFMKFKLQITKSSQATTFSHMTVTILHEKLRNEVMKKYDNDKGNVNDTERIICVYVRVWVWWRSFHILYATNIWRFESSNRFIISFSISLLLFVVRALWSNLHMKTMELRNGMYVNTSAHRLNFLRKMFSWIMNINLQIESAYKRTHETQNAKRIPKSLALALKKLSLSKSFEWNKLPTNNFICFSYFNFAW